MSSFYGSGIIISGGGGGGGGVSDINVFLMDETPASSDYAKVYNLYQTKDGITEKTGTINIPKDLVVKSGSIGTVITQNVPYQGAEVGDLYIDLVIQNQTEHIYIPVNALVDVYTGSVGTEVNINVVNGVISATVNNNSITFNKLSTTVQDSLGKADTAVQEIQEGSANGTIGVRAGSEENFTNVAVHGLGSAAYTASTAYDVSGAAAAVLGSNSDAAGAATVYGANKAAAAVQNVINDLNVSDFIVTNQYVSAVSQSAGQITVSRASLPDYSETYEPIGAETRANNYTDDALTWGSF